MEKDTYGQGFPSRWVYAEEKLKDALDRSKFADVISEVLDPRNFFETDFKIEEVLNYLNQYLEFDGYSIQKSGLKYYLKEMNNSTVTSTLFDKANEINLHYIEEHLEKCDKKISEEDFSGAITSARSLLENILIELEQVMRGEEIKYNSDLVKLYSRVYKLLNLDPGKKEINGCMKQILSGLISIISGLAGLRNKASDAHGSRFKPSLHHAKLAVNSAKTISDFFVESYIHQKRLGLLSNGP